MSLTKASYSLVNGAPFNVLDFGADPTGAANSAAAIQAAIDAAFAAGGGDVWLPAGVYNTGTTPLLLKSMVVLRGDGGQRHGYDGSTIANAATTIKYTGTNYAIRCGDNTYNAEGWQIYNIQFYGDGTGANGILVQGTIGSSSSGWVMSNVLVNNFSNYGINFVEKCFIGDMYHVNARNCLTGFRVAAECNRYNFYGCDANNCTTGFEIGDGGATIQTGISIFGGRAENIDVGVKVNLPTYEVCITGFYIESASVAGIRHIGGGGPLCVVGCPINTSGTADGIKIESGGHIILLGNHFTGDGSDSIDLGASAVYGTISGNRFGATLSGTQITTPPANSLISVENSYSGAVAVHNTHDYRTGSFTPTWSNLTVGNSSTNTATWAKIGSQVIVNFKLVFGSTTAITGTGVGITNLPFTVVNVGYSVGNLLDFGTENYVALILAAPTTTTANVLAQNSGGTYLTQTSISATIPHTWATSDEIVGTIIYTA
jgi:hypothetical protein